MRRSTHAFCAYCMMNLSEYKQVQCDRCLIRLSEKRIVYGVLHHKMGIIDRIKCFFESTTNKACCITFV